MGVLFDQISETFFLVNLRIELILVSNIDKDAFNIDSNLRIEVWFLLTFCMFLSASDLWLLNLCLTFKIMLVLLWHSFRLFFSLLFRPAAESVSVMIT